MQGGEWLTLECQRPARLSSPPDGWPLHSDPWAGVLAELPSHFLPQLQEKEMLSCSLILSASTMGSHPFRQDSMDLSYCSQYQEGIRNWINHHFPTCCFSLQLRAGVFKPASWNYAHWIKEIFLSTMQLLWTRAARNGSELEIWRMWLSTVVLLKWVGFTTIMQLALSFPLGFMLSLLFRLYAYSEGTVSPVWGEQWATSPVGWVWNHLDFTGLISSRGAWTLPDANVTSCIFLKKLSFCPTPIWYNTSWLFSPAKIFQILFPHLPSTSCLLDVKVHGWRKYKHTYWVSTWNRSLFIIQDLVKFHVVREYLVILLPWPAKTQVQ